MRVKMASEVGNKFVIADYGMGNLGSVANMLKRIGVDAVVSSNVEDIERADKLILPGVGAFETGMKNLLTLGIAPVLSQKVLEKKTPILGICLGMQLMTKCSEEGNVAGLGWMDARTVRFTHNGQTPLRIPHMGWNTVSSPKECALLRDMPDEPRFYFVHSYYVVCNDSEDVSGVTHYGCDFASIFQKLNLFGVQFHPEKSHKFGMRVLQNFAKL
jgi:glutamine amidotransferase